MKNMSTLLLMAILVVYLLLGRFVTPKAEEDARLHRELDEAAGRPLPGE